MDNIRSEKIPDSDNELWRRYFDLSQEIAGKHYPVRYDPRKSAEKFREEILENSADLTLHDNYLVYDADRPAAWFDIAAYEKELYFAMDVLDDLVADSILRELFVLLYDTMKKTGLEYAVNYMFRDSLITAFKSAGAAINEEMLISRLEKKDMNESFYKEIVTNNKLNKWRLEYFTDIPAEHIDRFIDLSQTAINDISRINPYNVKMYPFTYEDWKRSIKKFGSIVTVSLLFDNDDNIAGFTTVLSYPGSLNTIQHNGGLTAVAQKYRGLGIARYLKANLYLKLLNENKDFKYITTDTMPWNKYMYRINEEFGFKPHKRGCSFKVTQDFLELHLEKNTFNSTK